VLVRPAFDDVARLHGIVGVTTKSHHTVTGAAFTTPRARDKASRPSRPSPAGTPAASRRHGEVDAPPRLPATSPAGTSSGRRLARAEQTARVRIARDGLRHLRELTHTIDALEAEIAELVAQAAPQLLAEPGFGPLTAGKLIGEIAGAERFANDAKLARAGGIAPIPISSGKPNRHRLDRGGNRQINTAIHRVAVTRARRHSDQGLHRTQARPTQDQPRRHPLPQRHLTRRIWHLILPPRPLQQLPPPSISRHRSSERRSAVCHAC